MPTRVVWTELAGHSDFNLSSQHWSAQRFKQILPWWGGGGLLFASGLVDANIALHFAGRFSATSLFVKAISPAVVARHIHRIDGPEPDVLCAVEHLGQNGNMILAQRARVEQRVGQLVSEWSLGKSAVWLICVPAWFMPLAASDAKPGDVGELFSNTEAGAGDVAKNKSKKVLGSSEVPTKEAQQREPEQNDSRRAKRKAVAAKGRKASTSGRGDIYPNNGSLNRRQLDWSLFSGSGIGGEQGPEKLTERPNKGKIKPLVKHRLDLSEKYPVEYREAIQKWFQKRK